ncbi:muramoyltetrapeptide carboxypeptidase [uncultured Oxalobacter sp.]|uniref:muramoyltetrapeptide carboxypeptidase n=1 Tax=uncultured Oxalobacter sp. TaxID=337245 RepID=UPI00338E13D9
MKKFIVSVFLLGWLPLYAAGSSLQETEEVAVANEMSEAGSVDTDRFNVPLQKEKKRQSPREKQKRVMNTEKTGIAIIAPGGYVPDSDLQRAIGVLKSRGYEVFNYVDPQKRHERFAANDEERSRQIMEAATNPDVKIVIALRGGYGTTRLLHDLDFAKLAKSGKLFVGHSDFTVFEMALLKHGAVSFSGPMIQSDFTRGDLSAFTLNHFDETMTSPETSVKWVSKDNPDVDVEGTLWGGNLTMLAHLAGTPWMPDISGGILFVEDIHEHPYRVERMLLQLDESGILKKQKALVLGHFSEFKLSDYDNGYDFNAMLSWLRSRLSIPVVTGLPFGHTKDKVTLPVGGRAHLMSKAGKIQLDIGDYPTVR